MLKWILFSVLATCCAGGCFNTELPEIDEGAILGDPADGGADETPSGSEQASMCGEECFVGEGVCRTRGTMDCSSDAMTPQCNATAGTPLKEFCDSGVDEDCDGHVDEAPEGGCCEDAHCTGGDVCHRLPTEVDPAKPGQCGPACSPDIWSDPAHCGSCDRACAEGLLCELGRCVSSISSGDAGACPEDSRPCGDACLENTKCCLDEECGDDELCQDGSCVSDTCDSVDLKTDSQHCGMCNHACGTDETCEDGTCTAPPAPPCGGADLDSDPENCGLCGYVCKDEETCDGAGHCVLTCDADVDKDPNNCGSCGRKCSTGLECEAGECVDTSPAAMMCPVGQKVCGAMCIADAACCTAADCGRGESCEGGSCVECVVSGECDNDELCEAGKCVPKPVPCGGTCR